MTRIPVGAPSRSVTALGWFFTALGAMVPVTLALPELRLSAWMVAGLAVLATWCTVSGVGLVQRLDWARRAFIGLLGSAVAVQLGALWPQWQWLRTAASIEMPLFALLASVACIAATVWAIGRLLSPRVRREFA